MDKNKLITLKEAAKISGYTPDYIGQLIRSGKIKGEKVYCQITWMTTEADLLVYKNNFSDEDEKKSFLAMFFNFIKAYKNKIESELEFLNIFLKNIKTIIPILIILVSCCIVICFFLLDNFFNSYDFYSKTANAISPEIIRQEALNY
jgi:hypothetical protein